MTGKGKATEEATDRQEKDKERTSMEERTTVKEKVSHRAFCSRMPIYQIQQPDDYKHEATCNWHNGSCANNWRSHNFNDQQPVADTHQQHENVSTSQQQASAPTGQQQLPTTYQIGTVTGGTGSGLKTVITPEGHIRFQIGQQQYINKVIIAPTSTTATAARPNIHLDCKRQLRCQSTRDYAEQNAHQKIHGVRCSSRTTCINIDTSSSTQPRQRLQLKNSRCRRLAGRELHEKPNQLHHSKYRRQTLHQHQWWS